jgi:hypothetical protein
MRKQLKQPSRVIIFVVLVLATCSPKTSEWVGLLAEAWSIDRMPTISRQFGIEAEERHRSGGGTVGD